MAVSITTHPKRIACLLLCVISCAGCHRFSTQGQPLKLMPGALLPPPPVEVPVANPAHVGAVDPEFLWRQIADTIDDHFRIQTEQQVRRDQVNWLPGRLTTFPEISGTVFEPWRSDTARGFERLQSTIQTIRRTAVVNVIPEQTGYLIEIEVLKEQEDVDQSQFASAGSATQRHDGSIVRNENLLRQSPVTLGWYEIGRDRELERRMMASLLGRITNVEPPSKNFFDR